VASAPGVFRQGQLRRGQVGPPAFDFYARGGCIDEDVKLFDPHARQMHAGVCEAGLGDAFGEGLNQPDMAGRDDAADLLRPFLVVDHPGELIASDRLA